MKFPATIHLATFLLAGLLFVFTAQSARASSAGFVLSAQGIELGKPEEVVVNNQAQPVRYATTIEVGKTFTLLAQGRIYPRSSNPEVAKGSPSEAEEARWRFDDQDFKLVEHDAKEYDKAMTVLRLQANTIGRTRVRFTGKILGYVRTFDILIDIVGAKENG